MLDIVMQGKSPKEAKKSFSQMMEGRTLQGGTYVIGEQVGKGGMSWLYRATHVVLREPMAVKLLFPHLAENDEIRSRFLDEARIQFRLRHSNIVQVTDVLEGDGMLGSVMEWIDGQDLRQFLRRSAGPLPPKQIWELIRPILDAVSYIHDNGVVHRDIKPGNILLRFGEHRMVPKLVDFGIAKISKDQDDTGLTLSGSVLGTAKYMPPEQILDSKSVDARADLYSLGVTMFRMATGHLPFEGKKSDLAHKHLYEHPPKPSQIHSGVSPALDEVLLRCLEKDPSRRFQSCRELSLALAVAVAESKPLNFNTTYPALPVMPSASPAPPVQAEESAEESTAAYGKESPVPEGGDNDGIPTLSLKGKNLNSAKTLEYPPEEEIRLLDEPSIDLDDKALLSIGGATRIEREGGPEVVYREELKTRKEPMPHFDNLKTIEDLDLASLPLEVLEQRFLAQQAKKEEAPTILSRPVGAEEKESQPKPYKIATGAEQRIAERLRNASLPLQEPKVASRWFWLWMGVVLVSGFASGVLWWWLKS